MDARGTNFICMGATSSRMLKNLSLGNPICISVTHIDGIVLARSLFHSSMNYRSVVLFGTGNLVKDQEKMEALKIVSEQIIAGRWDEARLPNAKELKATSVIEFEIDEASAKIREGHTMDDKADYQSDIWAGVIPLEQHIAEIVPDPNLRTDIAIPTSVRKYVNS